MLPDRVSNPGPLTYESSALPIALRGPAKLWFLCGHIHRIYCGKNSKLSTQMSLVLHSRRDNRDNLGIIFLISSKNVFCDP